MIYIYIIWVHVQAVWTSCNGELALLKWLSNQVIRSYNMSVSESKYKVKILKMGFSQNNEAIGRIIGDSDRCQNSIMETLIDVKIRPDS